MGGKRIMKAIVAEDFGEVSLKNVEMPKVKSSDVMIKVKACGVDRTDVIAWIKKEYVAAGYRTRQKYKFPVILGAEASGEITEVGKEVSGWNIGDRVIPEYYTDMCGQCSYCRTGQYNLCPYSKGKGELGRSIDGCFAEYCSIPASSLIRIPDNLSYEEACLTEMVAVTMHGLRRAGFVKPGEAIAILGCGIIGLSALQICKASGCTVVITGTSRDKDRLQLAKKLGADRIVNIEEEDLLKVANDYKGVGFYKDMPGFDYVFVAAPSPSAVEQALRIVRPGGRITQIGHPHSREPISIPYYNVLDDITIYGTSVNTREDWERSLSLMAKGIVKVKDMIKTYPLEKWEQAFKDFWEGKVIRSVLIP